MIGVCDNASDEQMFWFKHVSSETCNDWLYMKRKKIKLFYLHRLDLKSKLSSNMQFERAGALSWLYWPKLVNTLVLVVLLA